MIKVVAAKKKPAGVREVQAALPAVTAAAVNGVRLEAPVVFVLR
jgi:hypothetical protein